MATLSRGVLEQFKKDLHYKSIPLELRVGEIVLEARDYVFEGLRIVGIVYYIKEEKDTEKLEVHVSGVPYKVPIKDINK